MAHDRPFPSLGLICVGCGARVKEFLIENCLGEVVWPPTREQIRAIPRQKPLKRVRRKPVEPEPEGYRVILPWGRG